MRRHYKGGWFKTLAFLENNTLYSTTGRETKSQWREYIAVPGRLRIDYLPASTRSGVLYENGKVHVFQDGGRTDTRPGFNPLAMLIADVYVQPPDQFLRTIDSLGFRTSVVRGDQWQGRPVYVVGAAAGDSTTNQFWVDSAKMVVVRVIQRERRGDRDVRTDVHFNKYTDVGGWPVAVEVLQHRDGRLVFKQEYADVQVDGPLAPALFDPAKWGSSSATPQSS
jgi:hypothetical protein